MIVSYCYDSRDTQLLMHDFTPTPSKCCYDIVTAVFLRASPAIKYSKTRRLQCIYLYIYIFSCLACVVAFQQVRYAAAGLPKCKKDDDRGRKRGQLKVSPVFVAVSYLRITTVDARNACTGLGECIYISIFLHRTQRLRAEASPCYPLCWSLIFL